MKATRAASRYGASLLQFAIAENKTEEVKADAEVVLNAINNSRELRNLLASPIIKPSAKGELIKKIFQGNVSEITQRFLALIVTQSRENALKQIFEAFIVKYREHKNIVSAKITSASTLDSKTANDLKVRLEKALGKTVELVEEINPDLIGGFVLDAADYRLDASVASGMKKLKRELIN